MNSKKMKAIMFAALIAVSFVAAISTVQAVQIIEHPEPDLAWKNTDSTGDVTDVATGDLTGNGVADVAFTDSQFPDTVFVAYGHNGTVYWQNESVAGYSIAIGDIDGDTENEVIVGGVNNDNSGITVFESDGTFKFFYETDSPTVTDIEIGDVDNDGTDDIVACDPADDGWIYVINSTGGNVTGWPEGPLFGAILDVAIGNLDGVGGADVAALSSSWGGGTLYVYNSTGDQLWVNYTVGGRSVEIGDVDGDGESEVVIGDYGSNNVYVYDGATGDLEYSFYTVHSPTEVELGDLDGDASDLEIAVITGFEEDDTIFAIDIDTTGQVNEMWSYSIDWTPSYYGEGLAIGDIDRDYKNEVIAASNGYGYRVYAFDGTDSNGDGTGDVVWMYDDIYEDINDIEVGDVDGDGDMDVIVGTNHGEEECVYAIYTQEHTVEVGGETIYFDSDPSNITEVASVGMPPNPPDGYNFPYGMFSFNITVPPSESAIVTLTLPDNLPADSVYWKYGPTPDNPVDHWYDDIPIGSNDGDNIITIQLTDNEIGDDDCEENGMIVDPGGPATPTTTPPPPPSVPAMTPLGIAALVGLLGLIGAGILMRRK